DELRSIEGSSIERRRRKKQGCNKMSFALNFKDVEDSVRSFDESSDYSVERWISDFKDAATLFGWNDVQKLIFARKFIKGVAATLLRSEGVITSWKKLKAILADEFSTKISSVDLHQMLTARKKK
ncbi:hypothetical protein EAI_14404, partial [Harpegnathos saltator]